jgi:SAM-dependent methyltransferase
MTIAYYRTRADSEYWSRHWERQSLEHLLAVAETSELTSFLSDRIRPGERVLEAGCGLGQYVSYFGQRGIDIVGVDYSASAIASHRLRFPDSDVRVADLTSLPFTDESFDACLSLGVIEHYGDGPDAILGELRRVLRPRGRLLLSTPYANLARRTLRRRIERAQSRVAAAGGHFYQFAFDEPTLNAILARAGFRVTERSYYDPGRGLRDLAALAGFGRIRTARPSALRSKPRPHPTWKRRVLYAKPTLRAIAHMQIVCATKSRQ